MALDSIRFERPRISPGARTLTGPAYSDEAVFREEQERLFRNHWFCIGRSEQLPRAGDYRLVEVAGENLIVVRGHDERPRGFYNQCRHRGTQLCTSAAGTFNRTIRCPYHSWSYDLDGQLRSAPNMNDVEGFEKGDYPLLPVSTAEWEGFLFVHLNPNPTDFTNVYPALDARFAPWKIATLREASAIEYDLAANWKQICENYSECYHCPGVHPQLCKLSPANSGRNDLMEGSVLGGYSTLYPEAETLSRSGKSTRPPLGTVSGDNLKRAYYYVVFPNMLLSLFPDYVMLHTLWPISARRTKVRCSWLFDAKVVDTRGFDPSDVVEFWDLTNRQDWEMCERTQTGTQSRAYVPGPYAHAEGLLAAFDREYLLRMNGKDDETG